MGAELVQPGRDDRQLHEVAERAMRRHGVPGLAVGLVYPGGEQVVGFGVTNVEHPLSVDGETLFQAGSITKTLTATAVLRLVERGALALDAPVRTYLPALRLADEDVAAHVTLAHLLAHVAGWAEFSEGRMLPPDTGAGDDALARVVPALADLRQEHPLGARWAYSNHSYALIGRVIEVATGQTYEAAIAELVLAPLGMARSCFFAAEAITHRVAVGHWARPTGPVVAQPWALPRSASPAGGLISTVTDLLRYARFHLGDGTTVDGTRLLSPASLAGMRAPQHPADWMADAVGLSWYLRRAGDLEIAGHDGITNGQQAALMLVPAHGFALVVLTNSNRGAEAVYEIAAWALGRHLDVPRPPAFDRYLEAVRGLG